MKKFLLIAIIVLCCTEVRAQILYVSVGQYSSIQSAIDDANDGDTVIVSTGTYQENIDFLGKAVTVRSADPNDSNIVAATIIDGSNPVDPNIASVVTFTSGEDGSSVLSGFTIENGIGQSDPTVNWRLWSGVNGDGGGVLCSNASPTITKNTFRNCHAEYGGGGVFCHNNASPVVAHNTFLNNYAGWYGGAIFARLQCSPTISNNVFRQNQCRYLGGAIYLADQCYSRVTNNWFERNTCQLSNGGALYCMVNSAPVIANNFIIGNRAYSGGSAIMLETPGSKIINNTIMSNQIINPSAYSAALAIFFDPLIANNLIINNEGAGIYTGSGSSPAIHNNDVWNNSSADYVGTVPNQTGQNGNISTEPLLGALLPQPFTVYELEPNSPCRDAGNNADLPLWLEADYDGTGRIVNAVVDIGAQEYRTIAVPHDYLSIQAAVNAAGSGDEIIVSPGFYQENIDFLGKNIMLRSLNPLDTNGVAGTVIDGDALASCVTLVSGEDKRSIIAGFTIQNGHGEFGGGIYIADNGGATILYNHIRNNMADRYGGGIDTRHYSDTIIEYNRIEDNHANNAGGGIHVGAYAGCRIFRNRIAQNQTNAARQGGGIYCYNYADVKIIENEICRNWSSSGGAIYTWKANGTIAGNHIWANSGDAIAGAIAVKHSFSAPFSEMTIVNNLIEGNKTSGSGGGILLQLGTTIITNNTIVGNISAPGSGAGIAVEGAAYADITNNIVADNLGGSGIHLLMPWDPNLLAEPNIVSNDLWNNEAGNYSGQLSGQTGTNGNISADPCFIAPGFWSDNNTPDTNDDYWVQGDYRIPYYSPCRDAASSGNAPQSDFDKNPRPHFAGIDIGAYELQIYDLTATGSVDFTDLLLLTDSWLDHGTSMPPDIDTNGTVDFRDFTLLAEDWKQ